MSYIVKGRGGYFHTHIINCAGEPLTVRVCATHPPPAFSLLAFSCVNPTREPQVLLEQYNIDGDGGRSFVDAGEACLPVVDGVFCAAFVVLAGVWAHACARARPGTLRAVHGWLALLLALDAAALALGAVQASRLAAHGVRANAWTAAWHVARGAARVLLYVVVVLVGSGWTRARTRLPARTKTVLAAVFVLQALAQTALAVHGARGAALPVTALVLGAADVLCSAAVLLPVAWSVRALRAAAATDGKAAHALRLLHTFRAYYAALVAFLYARTVLLWLLRAAAECAFAWVPAALDALLGLAFLAFLAWRFRPAPDNPYMRLLSEDDDEEEDDAGDVSFDASSTTSSSDTSTTSSSSVIGFPAVLTASVPPAAATFGASLAATTAASLCSLARQ